MKKVTIALLLCFCLTICACNKDNYKPIPESSPNHTSDTLNNAESTTPEGTNGVGSTTPEGTNGVGSTTSEGTNGGELTQPSCNVDVPLLTLSSLSDYNKLLNSGKFPKNFVLYEKIKAIGEFDSLVITSDAYQNDYSEYLYSLIDSTGHELSLYVYSMDSYIDRYGTLPTKSTVSVTDTTNMRSSAKAAKGVYVSNRAMYKYLQDGSLLSVVWVEQDVVFSLSVSESYVTLSDYPTDVSTFVSELLNVNSASKAIDSLSAELIK
jgi:hypothetical protein